MYLWALRLLLERVSWCIGSNGGREATVTFAEVKGFKTPKLHDYRSRLEGLPDVTIAWPVFAGHPFKVDRPAVIDMLQVADIAASALYQAVEPDEFENRHPAYLEALRPKLYRGHPGNVTSYGLKTFPAKVSAPGGSLAFLRDL
jgi:hypothetical protein